MTKLYLWSRQLHRILVLIITALGLIMALTGFLLKYSSFAASHLKFINLGLVRYLHNQLSPFFGLVLILMVLTGLFMYLFPWLNQKVKQGKNETGN